MSVLALRLAGPMQSWGASSRFAQRGTRSEPTKSGVLGLLAAATGLRRSDDLTELLGLTFGVRTEQPGRLVRDFHTAHHPVSGKSMPLSYRFYLADAVFLALVEGDRSLLESLDRAVRAPHFPIYLGRRSCPPAGPVSLGLREGTIQEVFEQEPWLASSWHRRRVRSDGVVLPTARDAQDGEDGEVVRDVPLSFDPELRKHGWRVIVRSHVQVTNPDFRGPGAAPTHDALAIFGG